MAINSIAKSIQNKLNASQSDTNYKISIKMINEPVESLFSVEDNFKGKVKIVLFFNKADNNDYESEILERILDCVDEEHIDLIK